MLLDLVQLEQSYMKVHVRTYVQWEMYVRESINNCVRSPGPRPTAVTFREKSFWRLLWSRMGQQVFFFVNFIAQKLFSILKQFMFKFYSFFTSISPFFSSSFPLLLSPFFIPFVPHVYVSNYHNHFIYIHSFYLTSHYTTPHHIIQHNITLHHITLYHIT